MGNVLQVCIYNADADASAELTGHIEALNFVRLIGEVRTPMELANALANAHLNLVFFHLDPDAAPVIELIDQVATRHPEIALIAISHETKPEAILAPMRAGCEQFVCEPIDPKDLAGAVSRVSTKRLMSRRKSRCIAVVSSSGGAGATSIACNLALEIGHLTDRNCALADLDLQFGDTALNFDLEPKYTFRDLGDSVHSLDSTIVSQCLENLQCKVALLARPERIEQSEAATPDVVHRVVELLGSMHENVVLDMPRRIDSSTLAAFAQSDPILIVCQLLVPSIRNARRLYDGLFNAGIPRERLEILVNRYEAGSGRVSLKDIEELIKPVYGTIPNDYQVVARCLDFGRPVAALDRNNSIRKALRAIAKKLTSESSGETKTEQPKRGLLNRLLR